MRVTAISGLHGAVERLPEVARGCDQLLVLGDLINILDYRTMDGILVEVFGREAVAEAVGLRAQGRFDEARDVIRRRGGLGEDVRSRLVDLAAAAYRQVFDALPDGTIVTFGNVDQPDLMRALIPSRLRFADGEAVRIGSLLFGFVGGGVRTPLHVPGEVSEAEWQAKLERIGRVDVVCTHMPPRIPWYTYDVVARKFEPGSVALIAYVQEHQPPYALFGHVHNPLVAWGNIGLTQMVNVGHFQGNGRGFTLDVEDEPRKREGASDD